MKYEQLGSRSITGILKQLKIVFELVDLKVIFQWVISGDNHIL